MIFTIHGTLPSLNEYIAAERANRYAAANLKKKTQERIIADAKAGLGNKKFAMPVRMRYIWVERDRRRDKDNVAFAKKFIQDALVECGILQGDGWKHIVRFSDDFAVDAGHPRVEVIIEEVRGEL